MKVTRALALIPMLGFLWLGRAEATEPSTTGTSPAPATTPSGGATTPSGGATTSAASATQSGLPSDDAEEAAAETNRDVLTVDQDVSRLKERVFRSKATLQLLKELVLDGSSMGSKLILWHENKMSKAYALESIQYFLDGKNIFARTDATGALDTDREFQVLEQPLTPGQHNLQVTLVLRGNGLGVFSYLKTYSFKVQSSYSFSVEDGRETTLHVIANEKGGPWRTFVDRPTVEYQEQTERIQAQAEQ